MTRSFGAIHDKEIFQRVVELSCQLENTRFESSVFQWFIRVEERHDNDRNNRHHKDRKAKGEGPKINVEAFSTHLMIQVYDGNES